MFNDSSLDNQGFKGPTLSKIKMVLGSGSGSGGGDAPSDPPSYAEPTQLPCEVQEEEVQESASKEAQLMAALGVQPHTAIELSRKLKFTDVPRSSDVNFLLYQLEKDGKVRQAGKQNAKPLWVQHGAS